MPKWDPFSRRYPPSIFLTSDWIGLGCLQDKKKDLRDILGSLRRVGSAGMSV